MGTRRHGQEGALALPPPPLWKCCKVFLCISSYSKTLSGRIIYALFLQPVVGFWRLCPQIPTWAPSLSSASGGSAPRFPLGLHHWTPPEDFRSQTPHLPTPGKNHAAKAHYYTRCTELVNRKQLGWK